MIGFGIFICQIECGVEALVLTVLRCSDPVAMKIVDALQLNQWIDEAGYTFSVDFCVMLFSL